MKYPLQELHPDNMRKVAEHFSAGIDPMDQPIWEIDTDAINPYDE